MKPRDRREFLRTALGTAAGLSVYRAVLRPAWAGAAAAPIIATPLADNLFMLTGAGANVVAAGSPDGLVLVDGGLEANSNELVAVALKAAAARRVRILFNTHWHPEQTGSNERLGKGGTKIIAHENTKLWLERRISVDWRPGVYGPLPAKALPTETFYKSANTRVADETVDYGYMAQAHTDGDIYVFFRKANVLVAGGVVSQDRWPVVDYQTGGWIGGLVAGLDTLIRLADEQTRIVPANGALLTRADLQQQRAMYFSIYDRLVKDLTKGLGPDEVLASEPARDLNPQWGDPTPFVSRAFRSLWGHFAPDA